MSILTVSVLGITAVLLAVQLKEKAASMGHCDGGRAVSLFLCGGKAGSDSEKHRTGILHRDQSSVFVGAFENGGITYIAEFASGFTGCRVRFAGNTDCIFAKLSILAVSMPILLALLETVEQFFGEVQKSGEMVRSR